jgi:predicted lipid-binding transport protein (Tim44 family)
MMGLSLHRFRSIPMKRFLPFAIAALAIALLATEADAATRFGGGGNLGRQRPAPTAREAQAPTSPTTPAATPAKPAQPAATPAPIPQPQPSFMSRWGGMLAGLGIGVLLASLFGAQMGPIVGLVLAALLGFVVLAFLVRLFTRRASPQAATAPVRFAGIGSAINEPPSPFAPRIEPAMSTAAASRAIADAEVEAFLRVAKTSFIRLQAANDAKDLDDIRDYTTPEMYAEIAMQLAERGEAPQKTEVVNLEAELIENTIEGDFAIASVRFSGSLREARESAAEPFDEVWHVRKSLRDRQGAWLIAGIQQSGPLEQAA